MQSTSVYWIPLYEILPLSLAVVSPFVARRPRNLFFWFCGYWALVSIVIYSWAGEKMPWLTIHVALPIVLLGAWALARVGRISISAPATACC